MLPMVLTCRHLQFRKNVFGWIVAWHFLFMFFFASLVLGPCTSLSAQAHVLFGVENVGYKQSFMQRATSMLPGESDACLFQDMNHLTDDKRKCIAHSSTDCKLPSKLNVFCSGFSCTSLSPLNNSSSATVAAFAEGKVLGACVVICAACQLLRN